MFGTRGVAEAYTKLIEFKVKDNAIKAATVRLFRSLERIEKKLDEIGGKGGKGFDKIAKGAAKSAVAIDKLNKSTVKLSTVSRGVRGVFQTTAVGLGLVAKGAYDTTNALSKLTGIYKPLGVSAGWAKGQIVAGKVALLGAAAAAPLLTKALIAGAAAYVLFGSKTGSVVKGLIKVERFAKNATKSLFEFVKKAKAPKGGEVTIFDRIQSAKGGGLVGLRKLLDQVTAAQSKLISTNLGYVASSEKVRAVEKALNAELMARKRVMDQIIIGEQARTPTSTLTAAAGQAGGLEGLRQLLSEAQGIQDRMLTTNENYKVASARVRNIQKAINAELERRDKIMGKVNAKEQKSVSLGERLRGLAGNVGGKAVQAARPGRGIERRGLIAGGVGGLAGLGMASNTAVGGALGTLGSKTMGFAGMTAGAGAKIGIPGMGLAAKGIADTKVAMTGLVAAAKGVAAANVMNPAFVAALGAAWVLFGTKGIRGAIEKLVGAERAAKKTTAGLFEFAKANPIFSRLNMKLEMSKDAMKQLGDVAKKTKREVAALQDPGMKDRVAKNLRASRAGRESSGFADWSDSTTTRLSAIKSLERKNKQLLKQGKDQLTGERLLTKEIKKQVAEKAKLDKRSQSSIDKMFTNSARKTRRNEARIRMMGKKMGMNRLDSKGAENLMLGAGFPMLFGGGVGAVAGGLGGSALGNAMGMGGFGTQIIGSAIGTMLETLVMKANKLGETLKNMELTALEESGIKVSKQLSIQIYQLEKIGQLNEARRLVELEVLKNTGALPGTHQGIAQVVKELGNSWNRVSTTVGTTLGILATPFMLALKEILNVVNVIFGAVNAVFSIIPAIERSINELIFGSDKYQQMMWSASEAGKQARIEAQKKLDIMMRELALAKSIRMSEITRPFGNTIANQKMNSKITFDQTMLKLEDDRNEALRKVTLPTKHGGEGHKAGSDSASMRIDTINMGFMNKIDDAYATMLRTNKEIDITHAKTLDKLGRNIALTKDQNAIQEKINAAMKIGDTDTANRLKVEQQILTIKAETVEKILNAADITEAKLIRDQAEVQIARLKLDLAAKLTEEERQLKRVKEQIGQSIENGIVNALEAAIDKTKTLGEVAASVFRQISRQLLQVGVNSILNNFMPGLFPMRAKGGPVKGGSPYIVGEKGPELFVPGSSGNVVPNHEMGGANIVINVDASGSEVEGNQGQAAELGRMLGAAIQAELIKEKRPGGLLAGR